MSRWEASADEKARAGAAVGQALARFQGQGRGVRFHTRVRARTCPFGELLMRVPRQGRLLEVGCGHGLFALAAALRHDRLQVLGIDPSAAKVAAARTACSGLANVSVRQGWLADVEETDYDAVAVVDVLYLVPRRERRAFLEGCRRRLAPGGRLLLKEVDTDPQWKFWKCAFQEHLSVRMLGITLGHDFAYASVEETSAALVEAGFTTPVVTRLDRGYLTPHVLFEAHPRPGDAA